MYKASTAEAVTQKGGKPCRWATAMMIWDDLGVFQAMETQFMAFLMGQKGKHDDKLHGWWTMGNTAMWWMRTF